MTDSRHPIPPEVWERIRAYLEAGSTGRIVLHANDGRVVRWELIATGRVRRDCHHDADALDYTRVASND